MARNVMDLALLLNPMAHEYVISNAANFAESAAVASSRPRFGRLRQLFEERADEPVRDMLDEISHRFREEGAVVEEISLPARFSDVLVHHRRVMAVEAAQFHETRLRRHPDDYSPCIKQLLEEGLTCAAPEYARTKEHQENLILDMQQFGNMVLLMPATMGPAPISNTTGDPAFNSPWSYTGLPSFVIQSGYFVDGLPLAIQLVAGRNREDSLFSVAAWCEKRLAPSPLVPKFPG